MARRLKPDLAIIDISLGSASGLDLLKQLQAELPGLVSLVVSMRDERLYGERAIAAGARGYVTKDKAAEQIDTAIDRVLAGGVHVSPALWIDRLRGAFRDGGAQSGPLGAATRGAPSRENRLSPFAAARAAATLARWMPPSARC
jgi:DNA-binding NarL/FixJ family response regulator